MPKSLPATNDFILPSDRLFDIAILSKGNHLYEDWNFRDIRP